MGRTGRNDILGVANVYQEVAKGGKAAVRITIKKSLVRCGPAAFYSPVEAFPLGLTKGAVVGIDKEEGGWLRIIGTTWWISGQFVEWL